MFLLCIIRLFKFLSNWTRGVGNRDNLPPWHHTALGPLTSRTFPCDRFPWAKWKPVEVSSTISFVLGTVYRFPHLEVDTSRQLVRYLLALQIPSGKHSGAWQPGMLLHGTDAYLWAGSAGGERWPVGFLQPDTTIRVQRHDIVPGFSKFSI